MNQLKKSTPKKAPNSSQKKKSSDDPVKEMLAEFGKTIFLKRKELGLDLQQHQAKSGVSYITISALERNKCSNAILSKLHAIAKAVGLDLKIVLTDTK